MAEEQVPPTENNTQERSEEPPLNDDWDDDFGGFEGASPVLDEASASMSGIEASPSPWATFSMAAAPPDLVQSQPSNPPIKKPSPATPLDDPVPLGGAASNNQNGPSSEGKSRDDLPESERGQQGVNRRSNALDSIDVSLDDITEDDAPMLNAGPDVNPRQELSPAESEAARRVDPSVPLTQQGPSNVGPGPSHGPPTGQVNGQQGNLRELEERLSVAEMEKHNLIKQKEELAEQLRTLQKKVDERKNAVGTQDQIYYEMNERHEKELAEIREAGHQTLAIMIEEYKELSKKAVLEQQEVCERRLRDVMKEETDRCEGLLKKQEEVFNCLLEEERHRGEDRIKSALMKYQELQKEKLAATIDEERARSQEMLEKQAKTFEEQQAVAIKEAVQLEREEGQRLMAAQESLTKEALEKERQECLDLIQQSIEEERGKSKEAVKVAIVEATEQQREALKEANELAKQEMVRFSVEQRKLEDLKRQRSLATMDLFLKGIQAQLKELMSPDNNVTAEGVRTEEEQQPNSVTAEGARTEEEEPNS